MIAVSLFCLALGVAAGDEKTPADVQWSLSDPALQQDFPDLCLDRDGVPWIAYLRHDGTFRVSWKEGAWRLTEMSRPAEQSPAASSSLNSNGRLCGRGSARDADR